MLGMGLKRALELSVCPNLVLKPAAESCLKRQFESAFGAAVVLEMIARAFHNCEVDSQSAFEMSTREITFSVRLFSRSCAMCVDMHRVCL